MTKDEFINHIVANHSTGEWINATFDVEGRYIGVKAFGKWVQRMQCFNMCDSTVEARTVKAFREAVTNLYESITR